MDEDKYIDAERALSLGIVGEIAMPMSAKKINPTNKIMNNEKSVEVKASVLDKILAKLGLKSIEDFKDEELRQRLEDSEKNAKTEDDVRILDIIQKAGGEKALAMIKNSHKPEGRQPEGKQAEKRAASITSADIIAAYEKKNKKK